MSSLRQCIAGLSLGIALASCGDPRPKTFVDWDDAIVTPGGPLGAVAMLTYSLDYAESPRGSYLRPDRAFLRRSGQEVVISLSTTQTRGPSNLVIEPACVSVPIPSGFTANQLRDGADGQRARRSTPRLQRDVRRLECPRIDGSVE